MHPFTGIAIHGKLGQQFSVTGEWDGTPAGWLGGLAPASGMPPLPMGDYTLRTNTGDVVKIRITSMINRALGGTRMQPFVGIGDPPDAT
jgi:hypothetical protein